MARILPHGDTPVAPDHGRRSAPPPPVVLQEVDGGIIVASVEMDGLSVEQRAQRYLLAINGLLDTQALTLEPHATLHGFFLGPLHITFGTISPRVSRRTRDLCARDRFDGIALQLVRAGHWHGRIAGRPVAGEAGTLMLLDFSQSFSITDDADRTFVNVIIPRPLARRLAEDPATLHGRALDAASGGVLAGFLSGLLAHTAALKAEQGAVLAAMLIDLATLAFRTDDDRPIRERRGPERRLRDRVERLVAMRLSAGDLTPEWIARKLGVSRSELYAAFRNSGGIARLIWDRRLAAARALLSDPKEVRAVGSIAHLFGFTSNAHFSRAFKQRYGLTPTAARQAAQD